MPAIQTEPLSPAFHELVQGVFTAPGEFEVAGYFGTMYSWQRNGNWINQLNRADRRNDFETGIAWIDSDSVIYD